MLGIVDKIQIKKSRPKKSYGIILGVDGESYYFKLAGNEHLTVGMEVEFRGSIKDQGCYADYIKEKTC